MKPITQIFLTLLVVFISCTHPVDEYVDELTGTAIFQNHIVNRSLDTLPDSHLTELLPGDILVKPNFCLLPGMLRLPGGKQFGHAAVVVKGASDLNETELLKKAIVFESQARDVPGPYQVRLTPAYAPGDDFRFASYNFSPDKLGNLYRLRFDLTNAQRDSIISYLLSHDDDLSSYRAVKEYAPDRASPNKTVPEGSKVEYWYCSLLIWQAFYDVLGIDLDADKGVYVYPNDLVYSHYFNDEGIIKKRIRF